MLKMFFVYILAKVVYYLLKEHEAGLLQKLAPHSGWLLHPSLRFMLFPKCIIIYRVLHSYNLNLLVALKF
jgi:hypothetical protein